MVREGAGETTLAIALGHIPGTALPGQNGNIGVAGHRDKLFRGLRDIQNNDLVQFETLSGTYSYRVQKTNIVTPRDVGVLNPDGTRELTLVTCYPFSYVGSAPQRFIVSARQIANVPVEVNGTKKPLKSLPVTRVASHTKGPQLPPGRLLFSVSTNHSKQLAPGVSIGVTGTHAADRRLTGWVWLSGLRRTIWLHDATPVKIRGALDGKTRVLVITSITRNSIGGYLATSKS